MMSFALLERLVSTFQYSIRNAGLLTQAAHRPGSSEVKYAATDFRRLSDDALLAVTISYYLAVTHLIYVALRTQDLWLYFASRFRFDATMLWVSVPVSIFVVGPITFQVLRKSKNDQFALVLVPLTLLGAVPGAIVLCLSGDLPFTALFIGFYLLLPRLLLTPKVPSLHFSRLHFGRQSGGPVLILGALGVIIYLYLAFKYRQLLSLPNFDEVYSVRAAFRDAAAGWEKYAATFAKFVSAFSLATYAIATKRLFPFAGVIFIFSADYMLDGNKMSIAYMLFACGAYIFIVVWKQKYQPYVPVLLLCIILTAICIGIIANLPASNYMIALYDRGFDVSATLFADYFDFAHQMGFLNGGNGLLGRLFDAVPINYYHAIGERYFGPETSANADMISDAYVNFGTLGVVVAMVILRLFFDARDNIAYEGNREIVAMFLFPYSTALLSMGLQTALITGGFAFGLITLKLIHLPQSTLSE